MSDQKTTATVRWIVDNDKQEASWVLRWRDFMGRDHVAHLDDDEDVGARSVIVSAGLELEYGGDEAAVDVLNASGEVVARGLVQSGYLRSWELVGALAELRVTEVQVSTERWREVLAAPERPIRTLDEADPLWTVYVRKGGIEAIGREVAFFEDGVRLGTTGGGGTDRERRLQMTAWLAANPVSLEALEILAREARETTAAVNPTINPTINPTSVDVKAGAFYWVWIKTSSRRDPSSSPRLVVAQPWRHDQGPDREWNWEGCGTDEGVCVIAIVAEVVPPVDAMAPS